MRMLAIRRNRRRAMCRCSPSVAHADATAHPVPAVPVRAAQPPIAVTAIGIARRTDAHPKAEAAEEAMMMMVVVVVVMMMELDQLQQRLLPGAGEIVRDQRFAGIWNRFQQLGIRRCRRRSRWRDGSGIGAVQRQ